MITPALRIEWGAVTHEGAVREVNQDRFIAKPEHGLWAVADGMGGHANGERASSLVVDALAAVPGDDDLEPALEHCAAAIQRVNAQLMREGEVSGARSGSTIAALLVRGRRFGLLWAGDSRIYVLRQRELIQLTRDHTQVQEMVARGIITTEQARNHPMGHILSRAVGVEAKLQLDAMIDEVRPHDVFLICSDGLHGVLDDAETAAVLCQARSDDAAASLLARCLQREAHDNVTAVVIRVQEPTLLAIGKIAPAAQ